MFRLFDHIPAACPLCEGRVRGLTLCAGCLDDLDRIEGRAVQDACARTGIPDSRARGRGVIDAALVALSDSPAQRCPRCGLPRVSAQAPCWDCLRQPPPFSRVHVAVPYVPPYDGLIARLKHRRQLWVATCLARLIMRAAHATPRSPQNAGPEARLTAMTPPTPLTAMNPLNPLNSLTPLTPMTPLTPLTAMPSPGAGRALSAPLPDLLVPIAASRASLMRRGFNPAGEIARALGRRMGRPVQHTLLVRNRDGPKQSELGRQARLVESVDLFLARRPLDGLHVGLVDDVMTTGGTLCAASEALLDRGCSQVSVFVAARTPR